MISVRNLQLLLSGSKITILMIIFATLQSCGIFSKGKSTLSEEEHHNDHHAPVKDSIIEEVVIDVSTKVDDAQSIDRNKDLAKLKNNRYNVALYLPFNSNTNEIDGSHSFVLHFYKGLVDGLSLKSKFHPIHLAVFDTKSHSCNYEFATDSAQLVIGGFSKSTIRELASRCALSKTPYISPLYPSNDIVEHNPYHYQLSPSLEAHLDKLFTTIGQNHPNAAIYCIAKNRASEISRVADIRIKLEELFANNDDIESLFLDADETKDFSEVLLTEKDEHVMLIPSWSDPNFIYSILRQINSSGENKGITVYGMPQWRNFDLSSYEYYENLNLHITSGAFVEDAHLETQWRKYLYNNWNGIASEQELMVYGTGYDLGSWISTSIENNGTEFMSICNELNYSGSTININFRPILPNEGLPASIQKPIRYENSGVKILEFKDWKFQSAGL